jgi:hypothetical protein
MLIPRKRKRVGSLKAGTLCCEHSLQPLTQLFVSKLFAQERLLSDLTETDGILRCPHFFRTRHCVYIVCKMEKNDSKWIR